MEHQIKSVAVIGGGLGGLALAQSLKDSGIHVTIFERDNAPSGRSQGYVIGLNKDGISVVKSFGIPSMKEFLQHNDCSGFVMADANLNVLLQMKENSTDMSLVNRWKLREILSQGLNIEWNKKFLRYEEFPDYVEAHFEDGTVFKSDILVGADGSKSKVREQRCPQLSYSYVGIQNVSGFLSFKESEFPLLSKIGAKTLLRLVSNSGLSMLVLPFKDDKNEDNIVWSLSQPSPESNEYSEDYDQMMKQVKEKVSIFHPEILKLIENTHKDNNLGARKLFAIQELKGIKNPLGLSTRVTLLGDSAHAMTTHRGLGANTAFLDSKDLAIAISSSDWRKSLALYESKMMERGLKAANESLQVTNSIHLIGFKASIRNVFLRTMGYLVWAKEKFHL